MVCNKYCTMFTPIFPREVEMVFNLTCLPQDRTKNVFSNPDCTRHYIATYLYNESAESNATLYSPVSKIKIILTQCFIFKASDCSRSLSLVQITHLGSDLTLVLITIIAPFTRRCGMWRQLAAKHDGQFQQEAHTISVSPWAGAWL